MQFQTGLYFSSYIYQLYVQASLLYLCFVLAIIHGLQAASKMQKKTLVNSKFKFSVGQMFTDAFTLAYIKE